MRLKPNARVRGSERGRDLCARRNQRNFGF
jgi:hypothetical protein